MFKLCVFAALLTYASAGLIRLDDGYGLGGLGSLGGLGGLGGYGDLGGIALAPKVIAAPIAVKAGATSYQNSNLISVNPTAVVTKAIGAPIITKVAAPISLASPAVGVVGLGHSGLGYGGLGSIGSLGTLGGLGSLGGLGGIGLGLVH